jgi:hypothetical protein
VSCSAARSPSPSTVARRDTPGGDNAGDLALKFIKKLAGFKDDGTTDPDSPTATYFQFDAKDETSFLQQYVKHEVGALDAKDGYAFHMKLPLKRKVSITASSKK